MMVRYMLRCLKQTEGQRWNFVIEWHTSQESVEEAAAAHTATQQWDTIAWEPLMVSSALTPLAAGGWNVPAKQLTLW